MFIRAFTLLISSALAVAAQDNLTPRVDEILKDWNKPDSPGAAVAVIWDGKIVFRKGYGIANLE